MNGDNHDSRRYQRYRGASHAQNIEMALDIARAFAPIIVAEDVGGAASCQAARSAAHPVGVSGPGDAAFPMAARSARPAVAASLTRSRAPVRPGPGSIIGTSPVTRRPARA